MPHLLHGLNFRPQLSDEKSNPSSAKAPFSSHGVALSSQDVTAPLNPDTAAVDTSTANDTPTVESKLSVASHESNAFETASGGLSGRKKIARAKFTLGGSSPFPDFVIPAVAAYQQVHDLLSEKHEKREMPANVPPPSQSVAGCGEVNFVLEALIRTIISTHTHMSNADKAIKNVCSRYPVFQHGDFAGSVDWDVVRLTGAEELEEAIRPAGKAKTTSHAIMSILETVKSENDSRRSSLLDGTFVTAPPKNGLLTRAEILSKKADEMLLTTPNFLTLDYLHTRPAQEVFERLQQFHGVGVKTAACILLFCFQYPAFAVDTHVWRLCKLLGWVPATADRDQTFFHLDPLVPGHLKYGLHQLFIAHGKACIRCSGRKKKSEDHSESEACILEDLVNRSNLDKAPAKKKQGSKSIPAPAPGEEIPANDTASLSVDPSEEDCSADGQYIGPDAVVGKEAITHKKEKGMPKSKKRAISGSAPQQLSNGNRRSKRIAAIQAPQLEE